MKAFASEKNRQLILRASRGEALPDALIAALRDEVVTCGWVRASGVIRDVELRAWQTGGWGPTRRIPGPVQLLHLEGSVGLAQGDISVALRAVLSRETETGVETISGELVTARIVGLEAHATAMDDLTLERALDPHAGVVLLGEPGAAVASPGAVQGAPSQVKPGAADWADAMAASAPRNAQASAPFGGPMPLRPVKAQAAEDQQGPMPEAGDLAQHFAFGACDVMKSDGDRLHLRLHKDGRLKEIALEMLKVTPLPDVDGKRCYKLDRKL